jgi:dienelactone hydrolase
MTGRRLICFMVFLLGTTIALAQKIVWKETTIPMPEAGTQGLETLLVWPDSPGKHPLALLSHGSPRDAKQRAYMTALSYLPVAMEFARRGYSVAVVLRRGYGNSGGVWAEGYGTCNDTNYLRAALASANDLHAAINYLATLPQVDIERMIAVGVSAGGFATVALTANEPPKGLVAAISFAGGRGSTTSDAVCQEDALIATFGKLGKTSRVPMLWVYAQNDHFFNPALAQQFLTAFNANGGRATLVVAPAFQNDGHLLFSTAGIPVWTPLVDKFLKAEQLVLLKNILPLPATAQLKPPTPLSAANRKDFSAYLASAPHKAFAIAQDGAYGWRSGRHTIQEAKQLALSACAPHSNTTCEIYAVDEEYNHH